MTALSIWYYLTLPPQDQANITLDEILLYDTYITTPPPPPPHKRIRMHIFQLRILSSFFYSIYPNVHLPIKNIILFFIQAFVHEEMLVNRLMRQSQVERRIAVQLMNVRQQKDVIKQNRLIHILFCVCVVFLYIYMCVCVCVYVFVSCSVCVFVCVL